MVGCKAIVLNLWRLILARYRLRGRPGPATNDKMIPLADPLKAYLEDHDTWTRNGLIDQLSRCASDCSNSFAYPVGRFRG